MTTETLPLNVLRPSKDNPRSAIDAERLRGLAASIMTDGLLQNLVVAPLKGRGSKGQYGLISGHRRYQALCLLQKQGDLADDYEVPVNIRTNLSAEEKLRIATVENVQRENLPPLDEADAFARLLRNGTPLEDLEAQTGLSATTIKRRLALTSLCEEAQAALRNETLTLAQAEALTLGSANAQRDIVARIAEGDGYRYSADQIKAHLLDERLAVSLAIFPLERYTGTYTTDLFADDDTTYFDDLEQFWLLQHQAVTELADPHRQGAAWVEITEHYTTPKWHYGKAEAGEASGVLINLSPTGDVEVTEGLVKRLSSSELAATGGDNPIAPKPKPAYSTPLCRYVAHHKSLAVQAQLLIQPRKAKEIAVILMLSGGDAWQEPIKLSLHPCLKAGAEMAEASPSYAALEQAIEPLVQKLRTAPAKEKDGLPAWSQLTSWYREDLYAQVQTLSDADLDALHLLLPILAFGQGNCEQLDTGPSLFNRVAQDLGVDMRQWWRPDAGFLNRRTKVQLTRIVTDSGAAVKLGPVVQYTKAELVIALSACFEGDTEVDRDWLPGVMQFPAVEQDGSAEPAESGTEMDTASHS